MTGTFKPETLNDWLQKHNPSQLQFRRAVTNFTRKAQCSAFSPVVRIGTPPTPSPAGECAPSLWFRGAHSLAGEGVGVSQFRRRDIHWGTLNIYVLCTRKAWGSMVGFLRDETKSVSAKSKTLQPPLS